MPWQIEVSVSRRRHIQKTPPEPCSRNWYEKDRRKKITLLPKKRVHFSVYHLKEKSFGISKNAIYKKLIKNWFSNLSVFMLVKKINIPLWFRPKSVNSQYVRNFLVVHPFHGNSVTYKGGSFSISFSILSFSPFLLTVEWNSSHNSFKQDPANRSMLEVEFAIWNDEYKEDEKKTQVQAC